jgi:ribokinase
MFYTVGGFTLDDTVLPSGEVVWSAPGGNVLYSGIGAKLWGCDVSLVGPIGEDYPEENLELLRSKGFGLDHVRRVPYPSFHVWILHEGDGKRQIIYRLDSGRNEQLDPEPEDLAGAMGIGNQVEGIHICPILPSSQAALVDVAKRQSAPVLLDIIDIPDQIEADMESAETWGSVDAFLPSIEEVKEVFGEYPIDTLLEKLGPIAPESFAVKMGAQGSVVRRSAAEPFYHVPPHPCDVVDSTGAGDAFCGGFLAGYAETGDAVEGALRGSVSSSFLIQDFGALHALECDIGERDKRLARLRAGVTTLEEWMNEASTGGSRTNSEDVRV